MTRTEFKKKLELLMLVNPEKTNLSDTNALREVLYSMDIKGKMDFKLLKEIVTIICEMILQDDEPKKEPEMSI